MRKYGVAREIHVTIRLNFFQRNLTSLNKEEMSVLSSFRSRAGSKEKGKFGFFLDVTGDE